uniref:ABC-type glutathione-S-conjugate transporter n=1 Tax=Denticeps clupeoides TaxID=299321 RepID=A0AAY4E6J8_9TELE
MDYYVNCNITFYSYTSGFDPDLPLCVEQTVLVWLPLGFLWLCAPWHLAMLFRKKAQRRKISKLYMCKQVTRGASIYLMVLNCNSTVSVTLRSRVKGLVFCSQLLVMLCQESVRRKEKTFDSGSLFMFWLLLVLCGVFPFQTLLREALRLSFCIWTSELMLICHLLFSPSMVFHGYKRPLVQDDMWELNEEDSTRHICQKFESIMNTELGKARRRLQMKQSRKKAKQKSDPHLNGLSKGVSHDVLVMETGEKKKKKKKEKEKKDKTEYPKSWLIPTILKSCKWILIESAFLKLLQDVLSFISPQLLKLMISFTQDSTIFLWKGYMYAVLLMLVAFLQSIFLQQYFQLCFVLGVKVRIAIMAAVYKKALVMSNDARQQSTVGETVNLMSADAQRFNDVTNFIHLLWSCPVQIVLSIVFLWNELGPSVLAGLGVMVLMVPINGLLATKSRDFQMQNMKFKDKRLKIMNEILSGIKILKLFAWEPSFKSQIQEIREEELKVMRKFAYLSSVSTFIFSCAPALVSLASFAVYVSVSPDNVLDAQKAFTSISLFNILRFPLAMLPMLIASMVQTTVSKKRLEKFLGGEDLDDSAVHRDSSSAVSISEGSFSWGKDADPVLKNVSLEVKPGQLVAVVGAVGSGKSSLLSVLLGEMHNIKGHINVKGSVAYVPQQAWIQNATLKANILFGSQLEETRYQNVLDACALRPDLELLAGGDETEIGEKGINLSGGQKQRVSLARAAYSSADTYLFDDPLSAVDSHVGKHLFEHVIGPKGLLKDRTRILVTHGIGFLPHVDEIVVLVDGVVSEVGSYNKLRASGGAFAEFLSTYAKEEAKKTLDGNEASDTEDITLIPEVHDPQADCPPEDVVTVTLKRQNSLHHSQRYNRQSSRYFSCRWVKTVTIKASEETKKGQRLIEKETMETGNVKFSVYLQYLRSMGWCLSFLAFLMYFIQNLAFIGSNLWLSEWTNDAETYFNTTYPVSVRDTRVGVFGALGVAQGVFIFLGAMVLAEGAVSASRILHSSLLSNVLRAPMLFFDTTPSGRVVNRFAKVGLVSITCFQIPVLKPQRILSLLCALQRFYVATSRQLRRLDSVSRSPIYSHFGETVSGLSVIRAYGHQERFLKHNEVTIDENLKTVYPWIVSNRWLAIRLESLGNFVVFFSALFAVLSRGSLDSGLVGLSISYALNVTQTLNWLVRMTSELETNIVAVERVSEYCEIENEAPWVMEKRPPQGWPDAGRLRFDQYKVRYRPELDLVLHGITCDIESAEKIGIVGRTGAGKSSLTNCLFRIIEAAEGGIFVDGVDIATIGLHDLRSRLTIIPQDPVLFSGTLRMNLDPFEKFSDEDIWRALELSHLKEFASSLSDGLQHEVSEGGENLSVGQRQLLCLARALLRKSRILILDEATAAVDLETDDLIQKTIRQEFSHCTVLTIAHRLNTILDSSRIMVLDAGRIVEFDTPSALFEKQGHFYSMAKDAGIVSVDSTVL